MYLKELTMQGFKSFPEKVKLEFNTGITAVVGPNGSGKSNVSDAVRWVLGEQRAKSLRGDKMEDIIFAGTQTRKALGFAEVTITIDNQDNKMPVDYSEVTVSRRVYRSGESEYQINGTTCRLKDIHELFMDTGVGREGYSIISQGRIDELLSQKGDDRRRIFEEAAGIVKYKTRKQEAWQKLEREQQNLQRAEDIIAELEVQLEPLCAQSEQAKAYLSIRDELKGVELSLFTIEADGFEQEIASLSEKGDILNGAIEELLNDSNVGKAKNVELTQEVDRLTLEIQAINDKIILIRTDIEKTEGEIRLTEEQIQNITNNSQRITSENAAKQSLIEKNTEQLQLLESKNIAADITIHAENERLATLEAELAALNHALSQNEAMAGNYQADIVEQIKISTQAKGDMGRREVMSSQLEDRRKQLDDEKSYISSQINHNQIHIQALNKQLADIDNSQNLLEKEIQNTVSKNASISAELVELSTKLKRSEQALNEKKSRLKILSDMQREHDGYFKSVKAILQLKNQNPKFNGICCAVGEAINVPQQLEAAIEAAIGGAIQNIITNTEDDAKTAINYLKQNHLGRATFLPISAVKGRELSGDKILNEPGVLGLASSLVEYDNAFKGIVASLLGRTIIIDSLDNAVLAAKKYNHQYRLVTLDGDLLNPGGAMTGGSATKKNSGIFSRSREINELTEFISQASLEIAETTTALKTLNADAESLQKLAVEQKMDKQRFELSKLSVTEDIEKTTLSLQSQQEKLSLYKLEESQLIKQQAHTDEDLLSFKTKIDNAEKAIEMLNAQLSGYQDSLEEEKQRRDTIFSDITEIKIKLSSATQLKAGFIESKERIQTDIDTLNEAILKSENEKTALMLQISEKNNIILNLKTAAEQAILSEQQSQHTLTSIADKRKALQQQAAEYLEKAQALSDDIAKLKNDLFRVETKSEKVVEEKQRLFDRIWEDYQCTYQMAKQDSSRSESKTVLKQEASALRQNIKALGNVNVSAIEQYKEVSERYAFLTAQKEDILLAEEKLQSIIAELSERMEERFKEQIELISQNFNEVFREMFGGGQAYLRLADDSAVLDCSIEIIAKPPGKSLQNMLLLSGGERALTAIAILFAILKMKPSPFCILDEIEAALDDANVKRYAKYLTKFAGETQFIVITHRKGTMEAADVMYGVTMQEKGVSKLISVNFKDKQYA